MELPPLLTYAGSWVAITGGIWVLFQRAETVLKPEVKAAISQWLRNLNPKTAFANWPSTFAAVFDRIFGERHLSWRCFSRSCAASFLAVIIVTLIWAALRPSQFTTFVQYPKHTLLFTIFLFAALLNLIPDYLSLLETRHIIRWMSKRTSTFRILGFLTFDLLATAAIFICWLWAAFMLGRLSYKGLLRPPILIFFSSTFFTSVWVWLYALSGSVVKLGKYLGISVRGLKAVLDIENKPLRSMGCVAMLLVTIVYLVVAPFVL